MPMHSNVVVLKNVQLSEPVLRVQRAYFDRFGESEMNRTHKFYEWSRMAYVLDILKKRGRVLDVGSGQGMFTNVLAECEQFDEVTAIDIRTYSKFFMTRKHFKLLDMSVASMTFPDNTFDVITCMEVLEHLEEHDYWLALSELRRVCRDQLILTVPFNEPEPLPKYHRRNFDDRDLVRLFPDAKFTLLMKTPQTRIPWVLIEERLGGAA